MSELGPTITELEPPATERLRALLDERGAEWRRTPHYSSESIDNETVFRGDGIEWIANDHLNGRIGLRALRYEVTPEQAVEATLGRGTCQQEEHGWSTEGDHARVWLTCGHDCMVETVADLPNFCPTCGAKVMDA